MEHAAKRRLGTVAAGFGSLFVFVTTMRSLVISHAQLPVRENLGLANAITLGFALALFGLFALTRSRAPARKVLELGLLYEIVLCVGLAFEEQLLLDFFDPDPSLSFTVVVLLIFPLLVPTPWPRRIVVTLVASLSPLIALPAALAASGEVMPETRFILANTIPSVVVGLFALYGARVAHVLRSEADAARQIGSYELLERIGEGAMGQVWRAHHRLLAREAALKLIHPESLGDDRETAQARFEREACATAALKSPHTVALYDYGQTDAGTYYYAMELLEGMTLERLVRLHGPLPEERVLYVLRQIALSLAEAHQNDLLHRDVKPANIALARVGLELDFVKVLDFGLVKFMEPRARDVQLTQEQAPTGTPAFMSPEVILGEALTPGSDLYSLGCTAYWMLTGALLFDATTPMKMMMAHVHETAVPPSKATELDVHPAVDALVMRCLEKDPRARFRDAVQLLAAIEAASRALPRVWSNHDATEWWTKRPSELDSAAG